MQNTNFSRFTEQFNYILFGFVKSKWKYKSINIISVLIGYFLFANFLTKFISEGRNELIMVPIIILFSEFIIRLKPSINSKIINLWSVIDNIRIGSTYAVILEAFKLGS
tara:strand:+ start:167 stop:493 length:327 start_codon:yes stop_codon:yes gene_type:complete